MKYAVVTFGCRVNQADSLRLESALLGRGGEPAPAESADVVLVNTCSVTASADQGARQIVRRIARANPDARIILTGCYATRCEDEVKALPNVAWVVRNSDKDDFARMVDELGLTTTAERFGTGEGACGAHLEPGIAGRTALTVRVQTGCDEACSYCIIPVTRGAPRSVPIGDLLRQVDEARRAGYREIALTGVHLGSYGRDLSPRTSLAHLLGALRDSASADMRFRISSLEPMDCGSDITELVRESSCFAPHFHLPLQHASDRMLTRMRRPYTLRDYADLVDRIRRDLPLASIGTDVIVGFPGETDEDFHELTRYLRASPVTHVHVFPYSDRPGTEASTMPHKVPGTVIRERARSVRAVASTLTSSFRASQVGTTHRALTIEDGTLAVTGNYLKVRIPSGHARNQWLDVTIASASGDGVIGEVSS
ncbi:MAG: tRNA (N(6)-L-threonylcarbamoyladenosine(37)-C(2))-methylthiotransferase MtaB [Acidimicrobiia bacterium]|nr:tRNA (N(6)-L-threonylcarbamoyladenosine(37)-C(2))-methylthiotransferase MtaB [Acidimicrobiia bacterium]